MITLDLVLERFSFRCRKGNCFALTTLHDHDWLRKNWRLLQSEVKAKPVVRSHTLSRASRQLHVITSSFDWFTVLSMPFVIGQSDYLGFGFTTFN